MFIAQMPVPVWVLLAIPEVAAAIRRNQNLKTRSPSYFALSHSSYTVQTTGFSPPAPCLVAIGPTANMRYLLGFVPHADERTCLLLVDRQSVRMVVPDLNQEEVASHTAINLFGWDDADGPQAALRQALASIRTPYKLAVDGAMRADYLLQLQSVVAPDRTIAVDDLMTSLRIYKSAEETEALARAAAQADRAMQVAIDICRSGVTEAKVAWATEGLPSARTVLRKYASPWSLQVLTVPIRTIIVVSARYKKRMPLSLIWVLHCMDTNLILLAWSIWVSHQRIF